MVSFQVYPIIRLINVLNVYNNSLTDDKEELKVLGFRTKEKFFVVDHILS